MKAQQKYLTQSEINSIFNKHNYLIHSLDGKHKEIVILFTMKFRKKNIYALITSYQIINEENLEKFEGKVNISINGLDMLVHLGKIHLMDKENNITIMEIEGKIHLMDKENNITIMEIDDKIIEKKHFVELDDYMDKNEYELHYNGVPIFILLSNSKIKDSLAFGEIKAINNSKITFIINSGKPNSNFAPIFNRTNHKLIGIYTQKSKYNYHNGVFLKKIMKNY